MPTQYLTFILRLRLESEEENSSPRLAGSFQQAGSDQIAYFDSSQKLKEVLTKYIPLEPEPTPSDEPSKSNTVELRADQTSEVSPNS